MTRPDHVLAFYEGRILPGTTTAEADAAVSLAQLDLEASRAADRPKVRDIVGEFIRGLADDDP